MEFNLADLFECVAARVPDREVVVWRDTRLTYRQLDRRANRLAHGLEDLGLGARDHVGLLMYSRPEYLEAMVATYKIRALPINVNYRYVAEELAYLFDNAELRALVVEASFAPIVAPILGRLPRLEHVIVVDDGSHQGGALSDAPDYEAFLTANSPSAGFGPRSSDDLYIAYTGGTTGNPKGVVWRHEDIFFATMTPGVVVERPEELADNAVAPVHPRLASLAEMGVAVPDTFVSYALGPLMHVSGHWSAWGAMLSGGRAILHPSRKMEAETVLEVVDHEQVTMLTIVGDSMGRPIVEAIEASPGRHDTTSVLMLGWAAGGILFGVVSDRWGRVKAMLATLLAYSLFSGLTGLARTGPEFLLYRFLGGMGIGGMFGAATTLVAESVPGRVRPLALGFLQTLSSLGNISGSLLSTWIRPGQPDFFHGSAGWRWLFFAGALPAVLAVPMALLLREPEPWREARQRAQLSQDPALKVGSLGALFGNPRWRKHTFVGIALGLAGMAGLWGIGFFSPELISAALHGEPQATLDLVRGRATALQDFGAFFGMAAFTLSATCVGRRVSFFGAFTLCLASTIFVFNCLRTPGDAYWMLPLMGFAQLSVFGGYSIYFPELFPTRLRGTGVGFCYNAVRCLAAVFPPMLMALNATLQDHGVNDPFRKAATLLSSIFLLGLVALLWAPETKGRPLPDQAEP